MKTQADDDLVIDEDEGNTPAEDGLNAEGETPPDEQDNEGEAADDEVVITIGDEEAPTSEEDEFEGKPAPQFVKDLRKKARDDAKRIKELEQKLETTKPAETPTELGEEPTLEACDYDTDQFKVQYKAWMSRKADHEKAEAKKQDDVKAAQAAWQAKLDAYGTAKAALKVRDYEEAEATAQDVLSLTQQGVILSGADDPAKLVYALGKNPKKAKELASITDPVKFAFAVAKLETQLKVTPRKTAPVPEREVRGNAPSSGTADKQLARLEADAERTGDRSKVVAYKRQLKARG